MLYKLISILAVLAMACASAPSMPLEVVSTVELDRYTGKWYEIASFPTWFQKDCVGSTAFYSLREDGVIGVLNQCRKEPSGALESARGTAWVVDPATNAKLKAQFFWPFSGDYWIIDLGRDYEYAVVGHPSRDYLWVLSRSPHMDDLLYGRILGRLRQKGYEVGRLVKARQPG